MDVGTLERRELLLGAVATLLVVAVGSWLAFEAVDRLDGRPLTAWLGALASLLAGSLLGVGMLSLDRLAPRLSRSLNDADFTWLIALGAGTGSIWIRLLPDRLAPYLSAAAAGFMAFMAIVLALSLLARVVRPPELHDGLGEEEVRLLQEAQRGY